MPHTPASPASSTPTAASRHFAIVGAGLAGLTCARTLMDAGHCVTVFEKSAQVGGRTASHHSPFGSFDAGAQYFTIRDERFAMALDATPDVYRPWSANAIRVLDATGHVAAPSQPPGEAHWVASPNMEALAILWAEPLQQGGHLHLNTHVVAIEHDQSSHSIGKCGRKAPTVRIRWWRVLMPCCWHNLPTQHAHC